MEDSSGNSITLEASGVTVVAAADVSVQAGGPPLNSSCHRRATASISAAFGSSWAITASRVTVHR